jgi:hypothetical protein
MPAEPRGGGITLHVMIADQGEVRDLQTAAEVVEDAELLLRRVLDVVSDELDEIRPDQLVHLTGHPERDAMVLQVGLGQVKIAGDD